jgi:hypothetical protein
MLQKKNKENMEHFYQTIHGWFLFDDVYQQMVHQAHDGAYFVEVGSFKGKSSAYMAVEIANSGKVIKFDCIDTWHESPEHRDDGEFKDSVVVNGLLYNMFLNNMKPVENFYTPRRMTSVDAARLYQDNSLDFVFIDADHSFSAVCQDIEVWLSKVKSGGILAGDDYGSPDVSRAVNHMLPSHQIQLSKFASWPSWIYQK